MRLIIDIGNTNVKIAVFNNNVLLKKIIYNENLQTLFAKIFKDYREIKYVFCCGGHDELQNNIENIMSNYDVICMKWKNVKKNIIEIEYDKNDTLGFDRIGLAVAVSVLYSKFKNHLVIDIGTCITHDFISQKKI